MIRRWHLIAEYIRQSRKHFRDERLASAMKGIEILADFIASNSLRHVLFGWISMYDLCIKETSIDPCYSGAHLRISPLSSGFVEFRYLDTTIRERQWARLESPECVIERLRSFLEQIHWNTIPLVDLESSRYQDYFFPQSIETNQSRKL